MVVKGCSVKKCKKKCEKRAGAGETHFSRRHRPLSHVTRVFFSLSSFYYVPTILSESLEQAKKGFYSKTFAKWTAMGPSLMSVKE